MNEVALQSERAAAMQLRRRTRTSGEAQAAWP